MLLAEEFALISIDPGSGRHALGTRSELNACLAGLLIAELVLDGSVAPGPKTGSLTLTGDPSATSELLAAVGEVIVESGPRIKSVLSAMERGLKRRLGRGTWDAVTDGLAAVGLVQVDQGVRPRYEVIATTTRDEIIHRLRAAAAGDDVLEPRTAAVLSMTGPGQLLELVAPERGSSRKHARRRIDHALESTDLDSIGELVRRVLADAAAVAAIGATTAVAASSG